MGLNGHEYKLECGHLNCGSMENEVSISTDSGQCEGNIQRVYRTMTTR